MDELDKIILKLTQVRDHLKDLHKREPNNQRLDNAEEAIKLMTDAIDCLIPF